MDTQRRVLIAVLGAAVLLVAAVLLWPRAVERMRPQLRRAWVAVEVAGSGLATVGAVEIPSGTDFTLHAVLEAETRGGAPLYYTEARRLVVGGAEVPADALRRWDRREEVKVLWFTVEGLVPYLKVGSTEDLERFRFVEFLRLDWPRTWAVPGRFDPANDDRLEREEGTVAPEFGTQRYQVRMELFAPGNELAPAARYTSWSADRVEEEGERFPAVHVTLPAPAATASRTFGLTHLDLPRDAGGELLSRAADLTRRRLAYSQVPLLAEILAASGRSAGRLEWRRVDFEAGPAWGGGVAQGDLVRAGARWAVLFRDAGVPGRLDRRDLCLDFARGAVIRPLDQVFAGGGEVELARLSTGAPP